MKRKLQKEWLRSYLWSGPSLLLIALVVVFPILYTFYISLTNMNVYHWFDFTIIGLENYIRALFVFDSGFLSALLVTVLWTVVNMVLQLVIAFASLLNIQNLRFRKLYKTLLMFPWAMPGYVSILLWKTGMFNTQFGLLNQWMEKLGLEASIYGNLALGEGTGAVMLFPLLDMAEAVYRENSTFEDIHVGAYQNFEEDAAQKTAHTETDSFEKEEQA